MFYTWRRRILGVKKLGTTDNFPVQPLGRGFVVQIVEQCYVIVMRFTDSSVTSSTTFTEERELAIVRSNIELRLF